MRTNENYIRVNPEKCNGCKMCLYSCALKHTGDTNPKESRLRLVALGGEKEKYTPVSCLQCTEPSCAEVCPTNAITRNEEGLITTDDERCIGCLICTLACPYGARGFEIGANKAMSCDLCDGVPECVRWCSERALEFEGVENARVEFKVATDDCSKGIPFCTGCGSELGFRFALKILGKNIVLHTAPGCTPMLTGSVGVGSPNEMASFTRPVTVGLLDNVSAVLTGVARHYRRLGREVHCVAFVGDGGTADVGFQSLSGAAERNERIIYFCNDNEAYMNTGIQRSSTTPSWSWTTTTPVGAVGKGKKQPKKDISLIMLSHNISYVATATIGFPSDFEAKIRKAMKANGFSFIHLLAPCPTGWRFPPEKTVEVSRMAVKSRLFPLWEAENGKVRFTVKIRARIPVEEYVKMQGRYKHLDRNQIEQLQKEVDDKYDLLRTLETPSGGRRILYG